MLDEEVAGKADAVERDTDPLRDFHVEDRQRDRDALFALEYFVEEAVLGIVVILFVAAKAMLLEQNVIERGQRWIDIAAAAALGHFQREPVDAGKIGRNVQIGIIGKRDRQ